MKDLFSSGKLSPIELAKSVINLKGLTGSKDDFDKVKETLVPEECFERVNQIIHGLEQEDEFAVLCKLMGTCESITRLGQTPIIGNEEKGPDFLASFRPGCAVTGLTREDLNIVFNCFVEVKSCKLKKFKITERDLKARRNFAQRFGMPLLFAIRFTLFEGQCYWIVIDSEKLQKQGRKVEVTELIGNLSNVIFDDYGVFTHPKLHFIHYYDSNPEVTGILHKDHGALVNTVIITPAGESIKIDHDLGIFVNAVLDAFELKTINVASEGTITSVVSSVGSQMRILSDIIYKVNNLARDSRGNVVYDATRILQTIDSPSSKPLIITREMIENTIRYLNSKELTMFKLGIGEPKDQEKILRSLAKKMRKI